MALILRTALIIPFFWSAMACADPNYEGNAGAQAVIDELVAQEGFEAAELEAIFAEAERKDSILEAISRPAEKTRPWHEYRQIFLTEKRVTEGQAFFEEHRETLERAEAELGVPAEMIVAIIGVETSYGRITGSYRVIDALSTLAFDYPKRSSFFTQELKNFLILTREQGLDPLELQGSYAGAMGFGQFMPSSYRAYAVDFDGDGLVDIWNNPVDAIGSVANYFKRHGWQTGDPVVYPARTGADTPADIMNDGLKPKWTVAEFAGLDFTTAIDLPPEWSATAIEFEGADGPEYYMGLHNFYVITRYNHSAMYAMSVFQLSEVIAGRMSL